jgi:hypothetical protein
MRGSDNTHFWEDAMLRSMKDLHGFTIGATDGDIGTVTDWNE